MINPPSDSVLEAAAHAAQAELWRRGHLERLRHDTQKLIKAAIEGAKSQSFYLLCSRRLGKTYELVLEAFEMCLARPGSRVLYLAPWAKDASDISTDTAVKILSGRAGQFIPCPPELRPEFKQQSKEFHFPNGSIIRVKGVNGEHAQYLRGGEADLAILDEIGLMDDLNHVIQDVVMPMTMTTGGRILLATTPARSPGHECRKLFDDHLLDHAAVLFTIRNAPHISEEIKASYLVRAGESRARVAQVLRGELEPESTTAKREYFCQFVTDANTAVFPEFLKAKSDIIKITDRPEYFDTYVAMDPGFNDKTGILYAHVDFPQAKLIIEDESLLARAATPEIADTIKKKEAFLWNDKPPALRICDVDPRLRADLWQLHGLNFANATKSDSEAGLNLVRTMLSARKLVIHPRCSQLIRQLENCVYDSSGKDFERTEEDAHFDLVAALKYLCRGVNWKKNPFPDWWGRPGPGQWSSPKRRKKLDTGILGNTPFAKRVVKNKCHKCGLPRGKCWHQR